jgi:two-component system sensor histidine kinase TctE
MTGAMDALEAFTKEISREARGIQKLITEYHDLATMQVGQLNFRPLHLGDTLQDWLDDWLQIASAAGIDLSLDLPEADWHILGDDRRLGQALSHLMDNAIKYMDGGGQIHLSLAADEASGRAEVRLQDTGVGISLADLPKIMNRFYRGSPRGRDGGPLLVAGSGQGLYFAQKIIAAHGGEISLASVEGGGTQVRLSLALVAPEGLSLPPQAAGARLTSEWDLPTAALIPAAPRQDRPA